MHRGATKSPLDTIVFDLLDDEAICFWTGTKKKQARVFWGSGQSVL